MPTFRPPTTRMSDTSRSPHLQRFLVVAAVALAIRGLQWWLQQADPLFWNPLGGNLPYLLMGERIFEGDWLPMDGRPFSISSPVYPWIVGLVFTAVGEADVGAVRGAGAIADALGCGLLAILAARRFGSAAGWATGLLAAVYAPMVHFSVELAPVPFTLLLLVAGLLLADLALLPDVSSASDATAGPPEKDPHGPTARPGTLHRPGPVLALLVASGLLIGVAVGTRPNLLLGAVLLPLVPWALGRAMPASAPPRVLASAALLAGLAIGIAPVPAANRAASGEAVLLTTGAGHNFYIGHNPMAQPQYALPLPLDGDIFLSMKALAEADLGRAMADTEVSGYFLRRALAEMRADPGRELRLLRGRILASVNDFEATTYSSVEYQESFSPLLRVLPGFAVLFALAVVGLALAPPRRETVHLWFPALAGFASVLLFFYIARLRMLAIPTLLIWAGVGIVGLRLLVRERRWRALAFAGALGVTAFAVSEISLFRPDPSNEWNKAGGLLRVRGFPEEAERFLRTGLEANPANPAGWRNLARVLEDLGRPDEAAEADRRADALEAGALGEAERYRSLVEGPPPG